MTPVSEESQRSRAKNVTVTGRDRAILWGRAAARCAYPSCRKQLITDHRHAGEDVLIGEVAHIVAQNSNGPRGDQDPPGSTRDGQENLILLCREHHAIVDSRPAQFPVAKLVQLKSDHETWVESQLFPHDHLARLTTPTEAISERVYSTLLPIHRIPSYVYLAECTLTENEIAQSLRQDHLPLGLVAPFVVRRGNLLTFCDLDREGNPFWRLADRSRVKKHDVVAWWDDPDLCRDYVALLNRSLNKLTGRLKLNLDKDHGRYYFQTDAGREHEVKYRSLSGQRKKRLVAWQPIIRATGEKRRYWEHLAIGLRFHRTSARTWCLSVRPERRFTKDGREPLTPAATGRRSTSRKSHMYNINVLREVHFWRDYLSHGRPRSVLQFGRQSLVIGTDLLTTTVRWPEIPEDTHKHMKVVYEDDLFSLADYNEATDFDDEDSSSTL